MAKSAFLITGNNYTYAGGNKNSHKNWWNLKHPNTEFPDFESHCICGHEIVEQCYIEHISIPGDFKVVGNCCIRAYTKDGKMRCCPRCETEHKRRKTVYCVDCEKRITILAGKYKGRLITDIYKCDPDYIKWLCNKGESEYSCMNSTVENIRNLS